MSRPLWLILASLAPALHALAADTAPADSFATFTPTELHWRDIPDGLGAQVAVIVGDPGKRGFYVARVRFPPHVMDLPHWHPNVRYVTVLKGPWYAGTGARFDPARAVPLPTGSVMVHPARAPHRDGSASDDDAIVQIVGEGPGTSTAVDPVAPGWVHVPP
jgi:hypothetical protein